LIAIPRRVAVHYYVVGEKAKEISTSLMESARFSGVISRGPKSLVNRD